VCAIGLLSPLGLLVTKSTNRVVSILCYMPYALIIVALFAALNLVLLPVSYVCALVNKYNYQKTQLRIKMKP
jgi:hypothetical protein